MHQSKSDEYNALLSNQTWSLVPRTPTQNVIGCKWVYRIKRNPNGSIACYKAHLAIKGFHQRSGVDFSETYSPIVKHATLQLLLALAMTNSWPLRQLDVNNAFLQGSLFDEVFMDQPLALPISTFPIMSVDYERLYMGFGKPLVLGTINFVIFLSPKASPTLIRIPHCLCSTLPLQFFIYCLC